MPESVLGIEDPWIYMAYLLSLAAVAFCVCYGLIMRNRGGEEKIRTVDKTWVEHEKQVEERL